MAVIAQYDPRQEILDNTIKLVDGYYMVDNGQVKSEFYEVGNEVVFINKGRRISWKPENMKYLDEFGNEDVIFSVQDVPLEVKGNYARYNRSMPDIDDWFIQENDRLKHQIIIQGFQRDPMPWLFGNIEFIIGGRLTFDPDLKVFTDGIEQTGDFETEGAIELYDGNTLVFTLPEVVAFDSAYNRSMTFGKYRVTQSAAGEFLFEIVLSNDWVASLERVYPIVIDPTVVIASSYTTTGTGRKLTRLSNGTIVVAVKDTSAKLVRVYKSTDTGESFTQVGVTDAAITIYDVAMTYKGNKAHILVSHHISGTQKTYHYIYDDDNGALTVGNIFPTSAGSAGVAIAINDSETELHAIFLNINIFYSKGTINADGSVSWSAVEQVTWLTGQAGYYTLFNPSITVKGSQVFISAAGNYYYSDSAGSGTNPGACVLVITNNESLPIKSSGSYSVKTGWSIAQLIGINSISVIQDYTSIVYVPQSVNGLANGLLAMAWHGTDLTNTSTYYIRFSRSLDGGLTWSTWTKLVPGINASLTADRTGKLYIEYQDAGVRKRIESSDHGVTWSAPINLGTGTSPSMLFDTKATNNLLASVYMDASSVKFDKVILNLAPLTPTNLIPTGGTVIDRANIQRLSWKYNDNDITDVQAKFDLQWRLQGDVTWNTVSQVTTNQYWDAPANTFPRGTIEWQVRTYDQAGLSSPYSDIHTFFAGDKPANPTITSPTDGSTVAVANPTVQWSSVGQTAYHVKVLDTNNNLLWEVQANSTNKAQTVLYDLQNNTDYKIQVSIKNADNLWSDFVTVNIHVSYTPPAVPIVTTTKGEATITISIDNSTPQGTEPNVSYNSVFRRKQGESTWTRIATNIPADGSFTDYTPASDQVYEYYVRAWGDNGTYSDSPVVSESISFIGVWLHEADNPLETLHQFKLVSDRSENWQPTAAMMQFAGRRLPVAEYDDTEQRSISVKLTMLKNSDDKEALENLIRSKKTLCYRDARGRKMFCHAFQLPIDDDVYGNTVNITFEEVSYTEEV